MMINHHSSGSDMTPFEYRKTLEKYRIDPLYTDPFILNNHLPLLKSLDRIDGSSAALFDMSTMSYPFLTSRFRFLLGFNPEDAQKAGIDFFLELMNSYDIACFQQTSSSAFRFLSAQPVKDRQRYKTCVDFRIRRADNTWIRLIQQLVILELDQRGNIWLVLIVTDVSPLSDMNVPARRYMEDMDTGKRVLFAPEEAKADSPLTPRELEILGFISRGYPSRDIADYLGISVCTVNNHRQKILAKTQTSNTAEALKFANDLNLI